MCIVTLTWLLGSAGWQGGPSCYPTRWRARCRWGGVTIPGLRAYPAVRAAPARSAQAGAPRSSAGSSAARLRSCGELAVVRLEGLAVAFGDDTTPRGDPAAEPDRDLAGDHGRDDRERVEPA